MHFIATTSARKLLRILWLPGSANAAICFNGDAVLPRRNLHLGPPPPSVSSLVRLQSVGFQLIVSQNLRLNGVKFCLILGVFFSVVSAVVGDPRAEPLPPLVVVMLNCVCVAYEGSLLLAEDVGDHFETE